MTEVNRGLALALALVLSSLSFAPAQAQDSPAPGVDITCENEETTLFLECVGMGDNYAVGTCTLENPSTFTENVEFLEEIETTPVPSFNEAFLVARTELGPGNTFEWNGNLYSTNYADELPDALQSEVAVEDILIDETEPQLSQVDEDESLAFSNSK